MIQSCKVLIGVSMATMFATGLVACDSGGNTVPSVSTSAVTAAGGVSSDSTINACDGIRHYLRSQAVKSFGFDTMIDTMKRISREVSSDQRQDLLRFTSAIDTNGINPKLYSQSVQRIQSIYADAMARNGMHPGTAEAHDDIHRKISGEPTGSDPMTDGYTQVLTSSLATTAAPAVGDVTDAYLAVSADQSHYELLLERIRLVTPGPNNGATAEGDTVTMAQYIDSIMPRPCAQVGSALPADSLNRVAAE